MDKLIYTCDTQLCAVNLSEGFVYLYLTPEFVRYIQEDRNPICPLCAKQLRLIEHLKEDGTNVEP